MDNKNANELTMGNVWDLLVAKDMKKSWLIKRDFAVSRLDRAVKGTKEQSAAEAELAICDQEIKSADQRINELDKLLTQAWKRSRRNKHHQAKK
jgi:hypothetical protein